MRYNQTPRQELSSIMVGINHNLPIILMDHQPYELEEARIAGVDLQLSGHTHRGQIFPINLITKRMFETDWVIWKKARYKSLFLLVLVHGVRPFELATLQNLWK
jgi:hypothetical protein